MLWLVSMGPSIFYGSVEVASLGVPMAFWDLSGMSHQEILDATDGALHAYNDEEEFAAFTANLLRDDDALRTHGTTLRNYVLRQFEIANNIVALQRYYKSIAQRATSSQFPSPSRAVADG